MSGKYRCNSCGAVFSEADFIVTTEQVARSDGDWVSERVFHCPNCESEDFEEIKGDEGDTKNV